MKSDFSPEVAFTLYSVCLRVSKAWKKLLEGSHKLWTTFDTTNARRPVGRQPYFIFLILIVLSLGTNLKQVKMLSKSIFAAQTTRLREPLFIQRHILITPNGRTSRGHVKTSITSQ